MTDEFYNSLKNKEISTTKRLADKFKHWHEERASNPDQGVFSGFAAIHYACYFHNKAALDLLLKYQYKSATHEPVKVPCKYVSKSAKYINVPAGSDCLFICVAVDFLEGAKTVLSFYYGKNAAYDRVNEFGQSVLHLCAICRNDSAKYLIKQPQLSGLWQHYDKSDQATTFLALAAQAGRWDVFSLLDYAFFSFNSNMREVCATALLFSNEYGQDLEQYAYCEVDCEKLGTTREEKVRTAILASKLMKMAHKWLSKRTSIYATRTLQRWGEKQQLCGQHVKLSRIAREISFGQSTEDFLCLGDHSKNLRYQFLDNASVGFI